MAGVSTDALTAMLFILVLLVVVLAVQIARGKAALKTKFFDITPVIKEEKGSINLQNRINTMHKAMWLLYGAIRTTHPSYRELRVLEFMLDCERYFTSRILLNHIIVTDEYVDNIYNDIKAIYIRTFREEAADGESKLDEEELKASIRATLNRIKDTHK